MSDRLPGRPTFIKKMKKRDLLSVYTDASGDESKGTIAFSIWDGVACLGRFTSVLSEYGSGDSSVLELIAIRTALEWVCENYPEKKVKLVTDSDTAIRYINHEKLVKEPYRSIADEIKKMNIIGHQQLIKSHTHIKKMDYLRNSDVDMLAREARNCSASGLVSHSTDICLYKQQRPLKDDEDLLKPVDARTLVKKYYVEKVPKSEVERSTKTVIKSEVKPEMTQIEKFSARFKRFKK